MRFAWNKHFTFYHKEIENAEEKIGYSHGYWVTLINEP